MRQIRHILSRPEPQAPAPLVKPPAALASAPEEPGVELVPELSPEEVEEAAKLRGELAAIPLENEYHNETRVATAKLERLSEPDPDTRTDGLSFLLAEGKLVATVYSVEDILAVTILVQTMNEMADYTKKPRGKHFSTTGMKFPPGKKTKIDVTPYLPVPIQEFIFNYGAYLRHTREFAAINPLPEGNDDLAKSEWHKKLLLYIPHKERADKDAETAGTATSTSGLLGATNRDYVDKKPIEPRVRRMADTWQLNCHAFTTLLFTDLDPSNSASLAESLAELQKTPSIPAADVRIGDLVSFIRTPKKSSDDALVHTALVIRVSGPGLDMIEVLEKRNPAVAMSTRTVAEILAEEKYATATPYFSRHPSQTTSPATAK
jgi:hypothetical protein